MNFCKDTANIWQIVGYILLIFKIVIPLILIVFGMLDLGKAVVGSKEDDTKKAINSLVRRVIAAVVIFFIPTLISFAIGIVGGWNSDSEVKSQYDICRKCITNPNSTSGLTINNKDVGCKNLADEAWNK